MRGPRYLAVAVAVFSTSLLLGSATPALIPQARAQQTTQEQTGYSVVITAPALNVRTAPTLSSSVATVLTQNEVVRVVGGPVTADGYDWFQIQRRGVYVGWSVRGFVEGSAADPQPSTPSTPSTPTTPGSGFTYGSSVTVTASLLNVRALPTIRGQIITVYGAGRVATITGEPRIADNITWYPVDNTGWVSAEYLRAGGGGTTPTPPSQPAPPTTAINNPYSVTVNAVNVRSAPSLSARVVTTTYLAARYNLGARVVRQQADGYSWIQIPGLGWVAEIASPTLAPVGRLLVDPLPTYTVRVAGGVNVRTQPTTLATVATVAPTGTVVTAIDVTYDADGVQWIETAAGWIATTVIVRN